MNFGSIIGTYLRADGVIFRNISIIKNVRRVGVQIYSKLVAAAMASSAAEHRCRRLEGKVAVLTASTDGWVGIFCFLGSHSVSLTPRVKILLHKSILVAVV